LKLRIILILSILLIILLFSLIIGGCTQQEFQIIAKGEPGIFGEPLMLPNTYYATKIISFDKNSVRFIERDTGTEKFITAENIKIERIK